MRKPERMPHFVVDQVAAVATKILLVGLRSIDPAPCVENDLVVVAAGEPTTGAEWGTQVIGCPRGREQDSHLGRAVHPLQLMPDRGPAAGVAERGVHDACDGLWLEGQALFDLHPVGGLRGRDRSRGCRGRGDREAASGVLWDLDAIGRGRTSAGRGSFERCMRSAFGGWEPRRSGRFQSSRLRRERGLRNTRVQNKDRSSGRERRNGQLREVR